MTAYKYNGQRYDDIEDCIGDILSDGGFEYEFERWVNGKYTAYDLLLELDRWGNEVAYLDVWHDFTR